MNKIMMFKTLLLFMVFANTISTVQVQAQVKPDTPFSIKNVCPFECCVYTKWWAIEELIVYANERDTSGIAFTIEEGEGFEAITGNVYITSPGIVVAREDFIVNEYEPVWEIMEGDTLYLLDYQGEGYYNGWYKGEITSVSVESWLFEKTSVMIRKPESKWWVKITGKQGRTGWINMERSKVRGSDTCGVDYQCIIANS